MKRKAEILKIIENIDEKQRGLVDRLVDEMVFLEEQMDKLKKYPMLSVHPQNPAVQKQTAAAIQYKRWHESYANDVRILLSLLKGGDTSAEDELLNRLAAFE